MVKKKEGQKLDCDIICVNLFDRTFKVILQKVACINVFCLGGEITYHGIVWRESAENVTARRDLKTESHGSVA